MKFRKRPIEVEAMRYPGPMRGIKDAAEVVDFDDWLQKHCEGTDCIMPRYIGENLHVTTIQGRSTAVAPGEWVVCEPEAGRFYPVQAGIFEAIYEPIE